MQLNFQHATVPSVEERVRGTSEALHATWLSRDNNGSTRWASFSLCDIRERKRERSDLIKSRDRSNKAINE